MAGSDTTKQNVTILGSTGSIGVNTLKVIAGHPDKFSVFALTAHNNLEVLAGQCADFRPRYAVLGDDSKALQLKQMLQERKLETEVLSGPEALAMVASADEVDSVMAAIVGGAGLLPTLAAANSGKKVLLANKEALVMAGELFMEAIRAGGGKILPIDSEHNAVFQCLPISPAGQFANLPEQGFEKIVLTASGGPFLHTSLEQMRKATPDEACAHPNWDMGRKISVDSATMLNKSLELIEASYLFAVPEAQIEIVIHPQSIVHSMVHYNDGSVLAQLGNPDMRTPIAYGLAWPERIEGGVSRLDLQSAGKLEFLAPDEARFPCLRHGREAARMKGAAPVVLNAANEVAVDAFLNGKTSFDRIPAIIEEALSSLNLDSIADIESVLERDRETREFAAQLIAAPNLNR